MSKLKIGGIISQLAALLAPVGAAMTGELSWPSAITGIVTAVVAIAGVHAHKQGVENEDTASFR